MYPFYEKPPQTQQDVTEYLTSWLEPTTQYFKDWKIERGFRRAFHYHAIYSNSKNEYKWLITSDDVSEENLLMAIESAPSYPTYEACLNGAIEKTCEGWKIPYQTKT